MTETEVIVLETYPTEMLGLNLTEHLHILVQSIFMGGMNPNRGSFQTAAGTIIFAGGIL